MRRGAWLPLVLAAGPARAHELPQDCGEGFAFLPGPFLLPLLSLGLMLALARRPRVLAGAALAVPLGFVAAPLVGINADLLALGGGLACAILAASGAPLAQAGHGVLALATALLVGAALTHGAGWRAMEVPALGALALGSAGAMARPFALRPLLARHPGPGRIASRAPGSRPSARWRSRSHSRDRFLERTGPGCYLSGQARRRGRRRATRRMTPCHPTPTRHPPQPPGPRPPPR